MKRIIIEGNRTLSGKIKIGGAKNSVVALIPAAIMANGKVKISNVPNISDKDALIDALADEVLEEESFHRIGGDISQQAISIDEWDEQMTKMAVDGNTPASTNSETITNNIAPASRPVYDDEIPPFDITISFANEYGQKASLVLYGVEILNEGSGFSIDNVTSEKACTFVARRVKYLAPVDASGTPQSIGADAVSTSTSNSTSSTNTKNSNVTSAGTSYSNGSIV